MTDRLKTVYPPKTSFCGGYKNLLPDLTGYRVVVEPIVVKTLPGHRPLGATYLEIAAPTEGKTTQLEKD